MATCLKCKSKTGLEVVNTGRLYGRPIGTFSLAGAQMKVSAMEVLELRHPECGWSVEGTVEGGYLVPLSDWDPQQSLKEDADDPAG